MKHKKTHPRLSPAYRHVCFDFDLTLVDDSGEYLRPGIQPLLHSLHARGVTLSIWSWATTARAMKTLKRFGLTGYFAKLTFREDWPEVDFAGPKNIALIGADLLVDDSPSQIRAVRLSGRSGFLITPFFSHEQILPAEDLIRLHARILPDAPPFDPEAPIDLSIGSRASAQRRRG
jgi:predicted HAD superfamily phosphohydrolase YqeG